MDSELSSGYERHFDDLKYTARLWFNCNRQKQVFYGLSTLLYVLILALFITVYSRSKSGNAQLVSRTEITDFQSKVSSLVSEMDRLESSLKKKTCDALWFQYKDSCYYAGTDRTDWEKARAICLNKGSDLVVINSQTEQVFLTGKLNPSRYSRYWLGLHDIHQEGTWKWVDETDYTKSVKYWGQGEPNDNEEDEDCASMWYDGEWNDLPCTYDRCMPLCEKAL